MLARRALASILALCLVFAMAGTWGSGFAPISPAMAQDDDDGGDDGGDDDDDDGGSAGSGAGGGGSDDDDDDDAGSSRAVRDSDDGQASRPTARREQRQTTRPPAAVVPVVLPDFAPRELVAIALAPDDLNALLAQGFTVVEETPVPSIGTVARRLRVPEGVNLDTAREVVRALPSGGDADFNHYYRGEQGEEGDCTGMNCPSLALIGWDEDAMDNGNPACGALVPIGVVDTGINPAHPTFAGKNLTVLRLGDPTRTASRAIHGTAVTALLIGDAAGRAPGLLPQARVIAVDAFHRDGGDERADLFALVQALDHLANAQVRVVNLSFAGPSNTTLEGAINAMIARNVVLVAAAGNGGPRAEPAYPAAYAGVIAVTAVDADASVYRRAGQGDHIDLAAPGVNVWTAASISGERPKTGTSFAAPFVTAAAALLLAREPALTAAAVEARLKADARDLGDAGPDAVFGAGLVQMPDPCTPTPVPVLAPAEIIRAGE